MMLIVVVNTGDALGVESWLLWVVTVVDNGGVLGVSCRQSSWKIEMMVIGGSG